MSQAERHVVFVPGKNPKPRPTLHREFIWRCITAGERGLAEQVSADMTPLQGRFHFAAWNHTYYGMDADIATDMPWVARMLVTPNAESAAPLSDWQIRKTRFIYTLGDMLPLLTEWAASEELKQTMVETRRYFENEGGIAERIRQIVKDSLRPLFDAGHEVMLIGHSLGSVIAYDTLWELSWQDKAPWRIETFLTLGSPLGMYYVQRRLKGRHRKGAHRFPTNIRHWINIAARGDLTALDRHLRNDFHRMIRLRLVRDIADYTDGINTLFSTQDGPNPHRCYGYFFNSKVARLIADWMRGKPRGAVGA